MEITGKTLEERILEILSSSPHTSYFEIAQKVDCTKAGVAGTVWRLKKKRLLEPYRQYGGRQSKASIEVSMSVAQRLAHCVIGETQNEVVEKLLDFYDKQQKKR